MCCNRNINEELDGDACVWVEQLCLALFDNFRVYMVSILLAISRPRDSAISLLTSIQGAILTENIMKCTFSDSKFNENSGSNIHILAHLSFLALF